MAQRNITLSTALQSQISGLPTKAEVRAKITKYENAIQMAGGYPSGIQLVSGGLQIGGKKNPYRPNGSKRPGGGIFYRNDLTIDMLTSLADIEGIKLPQEIKDGLRGLDTKFASYMDDPQVSSWVNSGSEMMNVSAAQGGHYAEYGVEAIKIGTMTAEAARSGGYITDKETMSIAMTTGGTVGGIVGSIFPGIGTAIGTAVGTAVGALVGGIVSAFTKPDFEGTLAEAAEDAKRAVERLKTYCTSEVERQVNDIVFDVVFRLSTRWINSERTLGYRFDLRWFDSNPGLRFEAPAMQGNPFMQNLMQSGSLRNLNPKSTQEGYDYPYGKFHCITNTRQRKGRIDYAGKEYRSYGTETLGICNFHCPEKLLGCLYPPVGMNQFHAYGSPRVIAAFHARGVGVPVDLGCRHLQPVAHDPPQSGDIADCTKIDGWGKKGKKGEEANEKCLELVGEKTQLQADLLERRANQYLASFEVAAGLISSDLTKTTALMQAKSVLLMDRVALSGEGVVSNVALRFAAERNAHAKMMNRVALAGGASMLGLALWKGFR
jgi:uncharacterized protein YcfJ